MTKQPDVMEQVIKTLTLTRLIGRSHLEDSEWYERQVFASKNT